MLPAALWRRWCGRWCFGGGVLPLRWWSSDGVPSRGRRPCRARGSTDLPCAAFFSSCCGAAALELWCLSRAARVLQPPPATDPLVAEVKKGSGARGASPCVFIDNKFVAARRAGLEASLKGRKVAQAVARWLAGLRLRRRRSCGSRCWLWIFLLVCMFFVFLRSVYFVCGCLVNI